MKVGQELFERAPIFFMTVLFRETVETFGHGQHFVVNFGFFDFSLPALKDCGRFGSRRPDGAQRLGPGLARNEDFMLAPQIFILRFDAPDVPLDIVMHATHFGDLRFEMRFFKIRRAHPFDTLEGPIAILRFAL